MTALRWQPTSRIAANWQSQLQHFTAALERVPADMMAWQWRVQIKVLSYLVARYGDANLAPQLQKPHLTFWLAATFLPFQRGKPARTRPVIRQTLERIAEANRDVR